jgi:hypothetical protein
VPLRTPTRTKHPSVLVESTHCVSAENRTLIHRVWPAGTVIARLALDTCTKLVELVVKAPVSVNTTPLSGAPHVCATGAAADTETPAAIKWQPP